MTTKAVSRPVRMTKPGKRASYPINPKSLANLKPYKPGQNGHGRVYPLKERLLHALDHPLIEPKKDACAGERLVYSTLKGAIDLTPVAFREAWDRAEGKVPEKHAIIGDIVLRIVDDDDRSQGTDNTPP